MQTQDTVTLHNVNLKHLFSLCIAIVVTVSVSTGGENLCKATPHNQPVTRSTIVKLIIKHNFED